MQKTKVIVAAISLLIIASLAQRTDATPAEKPDTEPAKKSFTCSEQGFLNSQASITLPQGKVLLVTMSPQPSTRVRMSLARTDGKEHLEIEWDPDVPGATVRRVNAAPGTYRVSFWVQPLILNATVQDDKVSSHYISINLNCFNQGVENATSSLKASSIAFRPLDNEKVALPSLSVELEVDTQRAQQRGLGLELGAIPVQESLRGLSDPIPETVDRVLRLIAEIAMERAKSQGLELLRTRVIQRLCKDFTWEALTLSTSKGRILPETCTLIENMRLLDIASAGRSLLASLQGDLQRSLLPTLAQEALSSLVFSSSGDASHGAHTTVQIGARSIDNKESTKKSEKKTLKAVLKPLLGRTIDLAAAVAARDPRAARTAQLLLAEISRLAWSELESRSKPVACGARIMVAVANACVSRGGCSATDIAAMVAAPEQRLARPVSTQVCEESMDDLRTKWPELDLVVERAVFLVSPPRQTTAADMARAATDITFAIVDRLCHPEEPSCRRTVAELQGVVDALIDRDLTLTLSRGALLIRTLAPEAEKITRALALISAFSAYAALEEGDDEESLKQARAARKQAIESLIDSVTDRRERDGEWVVSLGTNPSIAGGGQWLPGSTGALSWETPRLHLPIGLAIQKLPDAAQKKWLDRRGWHLMVSVADLAQYIPDSASIAGDEGDETFQGSVRWDDFVSVGGQLGVILGSPTVPFVLGIEAHWSPSLFARDVRGTEERGAFRFGAFLSYYVPFFDLN